MKTRTLILSVLLALAVSLSLPGLAQDNQQQTSDSPPQTSDNQQTNQQVSSPDQAQTTTQDQQKDQKEQKVKHGGKNDVDAIGNRKIGGMDWYSIEREIRIGKEYAQQLEQSMRMVQDPVINEYVNRIGQNLVRNSDAKVPFTIKVVDDDSVNAFALPGGFFYVNTGLILAADEEAELAGVMAHEIAHVAARHATRNATRAEFANLLSIPLIFVGGGIGYAAREAVGIGLPITFLKFSRGFEAEADYLGLQYMYKAGYDPNAFVAFFEKLEAQEKKKPGSLAKAFATHPQTPDRIQKSQQEIATILPPREQYIVTTSEFDQVKARLATIENRHRLDDSKDKNKPTLRRTAGNSKDSKDGKDDKGDDRPTLHRRDQ
ncbi:MAG TPA: M48 family metallopeptidase [Candidatus Angelobacter sp.]|nr:M48 family metallopeptidase [Candidatus Angelobacter sp.]